jgi:hypothetical protein
METLLGINHVLFDRANGSINYIFAYLILALTMIDIFATLLYQSAFALTKDYKYNKVVDFRSSIVSLGVLGTFVGIFLGLQEFNIESIEKSIPPLLEGLKTAFVTSIFAMAISIILTIFKKPLLSISYFLFKGIGVIYRFLFRIKIEKQIHTDKEVKDVLIDVLERFNLKLDSLIEVVDKRELIEELKLLNHKATKQAEDIREFNKKTDMNKFNSLDNLDRNFNTLIKLSIEQRTELERVTKSIVNLDKKLDKLKTLDDIKEQNRDISSKLQDLKLNVYYGS